MLFVSNKKTVRGALARMIFVLATIIHKGEGDFESEHLLQQLTFQTETKSQVLRSLNWTTPSTEEDYNNSTGEKDDIENETTYIGYGHDPWGPSTLMSSEENGESKSKRRNPQRPRRDVVHLYNMVSCATGCNPIIYKGYGCYCGFLGSGAPIDGIDRCCKMHDWCYNTANCPMFFEYIIPYYWKCYHHRPICAIDHGNYGGPGSCAQRLCECDRLLSECLSHYRCPKKRAVCRTSPVRFLIQSFFMF